MKSLLPILVLVLLFAGCASQPGPTGDRMAVLAGDPTATAGQDFMGDEIHFQMHSIDGETVGESYALAPGRLHTLIAQLTSQGRPYVAVIRLRLPNPSNYRISARRKDDAVTVTLTEATGRLVATSTATLADQMKFDVFVLQK